MGELNGYKLSRDWFDFCFDNPEKIRPIHTAIYFFAVEHWNRLGQKPKFGFPSQMTMDAIGIKSYSTYIPAFNDLIDWGFFKLVEKSRNQYSSNIIALTKIDKASSKALDKAFIKHSSKQPKRTYQSNRSIDKQGNKGTKEQINHSFDDFWNLYDRKVGSKQKAKKKWHKLKDSERDYIMEHLEDYANSFENKKYQPYPTTFLNGKNWEAEDFIQKDGSGSKVKMDMRRFL